MNGRNDGSLSIGFGIVAGTVAALVATIFGTLGYVLGAQVAKSMATSRSCLQRADEKKEKKSRAICTSKMENVKVSDNRAVIDVRIKEIRPLIPPACLLEEIPMSRKILQTVTINRQNIASILRRLDDRLIVIVGPCSIHDSEAAIDYAHRLARIRDELADDLVIVMRVYFEKPRTTVGWKGLINDPDLNGTYNINKGLRIARQLLARVNELGVPAGCEFLDTVSPQFISDLVSWGAIGARTTECQLHRELSSGLSMPIGFKNGTGGSLQLAVDAVVAAQHPHCFLSVSTQGLASIVNTSGNDCCHTILRGGKSGPNYEKQYVDQVSAMMRKAKLPDNVMIDCSHGNSRKDYKNQPLVASDAAEQIANGDDRIIGVMLESNLVEGNQALGERMEYGKSITDACMDWETTVQTLHKLAIAVRSRRAKLQT